MQHRRDIASNSGLSRLIDRLKSPLRIPYSTLLDFLARWSARRVGLALMYHGIGDSTIAPEHQIVPLTATKLFEAQVRHLKRRYRLVAASELVVAVRTRRRGQRIPVAITFDDDLASHAATAMPILRRAQVPATFFLSGASLSKPFAFWWERLQHAFDRGLVDEHDFDTDAPAVREEAPGIRHVASTIEAMPPDQRDRMAERLLDRIGQDPPDAGMRASEIQAIVTAGLEIGFHTRRHDVLSELNDEALARALQEGRSGLEALAGGELRTLAYPYGSADARVAAAARAADYQFGFTTKPGLVSEESDPLLLNRLTPTQQSAAHFAVQVASELRSSRRTH
jgi:peptidoglycan/xylan/chitin deacetylase (PgdA/CDA1 family)